MQFLFKESASEKIPNMPKPMKTMTWNKNNNLLMSTSIDESHQPIPERYKHAKKIRRKKSLGRLEIENIHMKLLEFNGFS